jgi:hypothetical protein
VAGASLVLALEGPIRAAGEVQPEAIGFVGVHRLREMEPELNGAGVRIGVLAPSKTYVANQPQNDYQPDVSHPCLGSAQIGMYDSGKARPSVCPHSTAVCALLVGQDPGAAMPGLGSFSYQGLVPQAQVEVYELWHFLTSRLLSLSRAGLDLVTISGGCDFEDWWTRALEAMAEQGLVVVASIGNGSGSLHPTLYPGASANAIAVGMVDPIKTGDMAVVTSSFWLVEPEHSSCGPTADGRCKPDLVAPGTCIVPKVSGQRGYELANSGSSFAAPIVAGIAGLLIQKSRQEPTLAQALAPQTSACLVKAILLNSAVKLPYWHKGKVGLDDDHEVPLDWAQGAGLVDAMGAYRQLVSGRSGPGPVPVIGWDVGRIGKTDRDVVVYQFDLARPADQWVTATLVWNLHYSQGYPFDRLSERTSDLRLELWAVDPADPQRDLLLDFSDSPVDNLEHIYVKTDPRYRRYQLVVSRSARDRSRDLAEPFAVAWAVRGAESQHGLAWEDLNGDGLVDQRDYARLVQNWVSYLRQPNKYVIGDLNCDGQIDQQDLQLLASKANIQ